jgi:hypothetical protein
MLTLTAWSKFYQQIWGWAENLAKNKQLQNFAKIIKLFPSDTLWQN